MTRRLVCLILVLGVGATSRASESYPGYVERYRSADREAVVREVAGWSEVRLKQEISPRFDKGFSLPIAVLLHTDCATQARSAFALPFLAQGELSPGKNAVLRRATARFTPPEH